MTSRRSVVLISLLLATVFLLGLAAPSATAAGNGGGQPLATEETTPPETTEAPDTTEAPIDPEVPVEEDDSNTTTILIIVGIILLIVVVIAVSASGRSKRAEATARATAAGAAAGAAATAAPPAWQAAASQAYSESRWVYENLTSDIALWRGDSLYEAQRTVGTGQTAVTASAARQETWDQLGSQMTTATTSLYGLESQVDTASKPVVRSAIDSLYAARTSVDEVAAARLAVHQATDALQADAGDERLQQDLSAAHDHENQTSQNLTNSRTVLEGALANLAAMR